MKPFLLLLFVSVAAAAGPAMELIGTAGSRTFMTSFKDEAITWMQAKEFCTKNNLKLATISSSAENDLIGNFLGKSGRTVKVGWLGGNEVRSWVWVRDGKGLASQSYKNWVSGQPSHIGSGNSNCLLIGANKKWDAKPCSNKLGRPICN